ncbi:hypothetical protein CRM22_006987 [Opisthorchis felineus]|uniref:GCM domain-containing protein n=1 Tax=Opisthorchis felineus TaxID=147828 RepID=A0A4S2LRC0_OPIFE|nr:hypothetical protein CRM22_006987 [Opisthorchis felineus]
MLGVISPHVDNNKNSPGGMAATAPAASTSTTCWNWESTGVPSIIDFDPPSPIPAYRSASATSISAAKISTTAMEPASPVFDIANRSPLNQVRVYNFPNTTSSPGQLVDCLTLHTTSNRSSNLSTSSEYNTLDSDSTPVYYATLSSPVTYYDGLSSSNHDAPLSLPELVQKAGQSAHDLSTETPSNPSILESTCTILPPLVTPYEATRTRQHQPNRGTPFAEGPVLPNGVKECGISSHHWDIKDVKLPRVPTFDPYELWPTGHCRRIYSQACERARRHQSGWAMRNTNNHNPQVLKKSCLGVLECSAGCLVHGKPLSLRPAICDKARKKQINRMCITPGCSGRLVLRNCRGHSGYPVTHFWRFANGAVYFEAKGEHDHNRPSLKTFGLSESYSSFDVDLTTFGRFPVSKRSGLTNTNPGASSPLTDNSKIESDGLLEEEEAANGMAFSTPSSFERLKGMCKKDVLIDPSPWVNNSSKQATSLNRLYKDKRNKVEPLPTILFGQPSGLNEGISKRTKKNRCRKPSFESSRPVKSDSALRQVPKWFAENSKSYLQKHEPYTYSNLDLAGSLSTSTELGLSATCQIEQANQWTMPPVNLPIYPEGATNSSEANQVAFMLPNHCAPLNETMMISTSAYGSPLVMDIPPGPPNVCSSPFSSRSSRWSSSTSSLSVSSSRTHHTPKNLCAFGNGAVLSQINGFSGYPDINAEAVGGTVSSYISDSGGMETYEQNAYAAGMTDMLQSEMSYPSGRNYAMTVVHNSHAASKNSLWPDPSETTFPTHFPVDEFQEARIHQDEVAGLVGYSTSDAQCEQLNTFWIPSDSFEIQADPHHCYNSSNPTENYETLPNPQHSAHAVNEQPHSTLFQLAKNQTYQVCLNESHSSEIAQNTSDMFRSSETSAFSQSVSSSITGDGQLFPPIHVANQENAPLDPIGDWDTYPTTWIAHTTLPPVAVAAAQCSINDQLDELPNPPLLIPMTEHVDFDKTHTTMNSNPTNWVSEKEISECTETCIYESFNSY